MKTTHVVSAVLFLSSVFVGNTWGQAQYTVTGLTFSGTWSSYAYGINNSGQVVGEADPNGDSDLSHAFLYSGGTMQDLGTFGGMNSEAYSINNSGQVAGNFLGTTGPFNPPVSNTFVHPFIYSGGTMSDLGTVIGSDFGTTSENYSYAHAINDNGLVVGQVSNCPATTPYWKAFVYSGGTVTALGTLGGDSSYAYGVNDSGQIVGSADISNGPV